MPYKVSNIYSYVLFFVTATVCIVTTGKDFPRGTESGGGGGVTLINDSHKLIDFYQLNLNTIKNRKFTASRKPEQLPLEDRLLSRKTNTSFLLVKDLLDSWLSIPLNLSASVIRGALSPLLKFTFTTNDLPTFEHYLPLRLSLQKSIKTAAYYSLTKSKMTKSSSQVLINIPIWNNMLYTDRMGLLIHEGLRQVQFGLGGSFDERSLQRATALLVYCPPSIELGQYIFYLINNADTLAQKIFGAFDKVVKKRCQPK